MVDEKINTIIDLGKSNIKLGIFDEKKKLIYMVKSFPYQKMIYWN